MTFAPAFTKPVASRELGKLLEEKDIHVETDFMVERIDQVLGQGGRPCRVRAGSRPAP